MAKAPKIFIAIALVCAFNSRARADTFTVPLNLAEATGPLGQYLSGNFDFQTAFSSIDSVTLEITMPRGFAADNNSATEATQIWVTLQNVGSELVFGQFSPDGTFADAADLPAGTPQQFGFFPPYLGIDASDELQHDWPAYLYLGTGAIGICDLHTHTFFDLAGPISFFNLLDLPAADVTNASLVVVGTAVPEPASAVLAAIGAIGVGIVLLNRRRINFL
jgi:hypothetical protein